MLANRVLIKLNFNKEGTLQILPEPENLLAVGHALHHAPLGPSTGMAARSFAVISLQKTGRIICIARGLSVDEFEPF